MGPPLWIAVGVTLCITTDRKKRKTGKYTKTGVIGICSKLRIERIQIFGRGEGLWRICKAIRKKIKVNMMGKNVLMV